MIEISCKVTQNQLVLSFLMEACILFYEDQTGLCMLCFSGHGVVVSLCWTNCVLHFLETVKLGIGGFSMGAATALYSATCFAQGKYGNGIPYPINLRTIIGLSGWLPGSR